MANGDAPALPPGLPAAGDTIDGKYALVRLIGTGGMGVVYEAEHLRLKQRCAIKMLSPEMLRDVDIVHRFEREARAAALLKSPHVTRVTDVATTAHGVPYIVMELLSGQDLDGLLQERSFLPYPEAVDYVLQGCAAIAEAHTAGIIHRDLKPGNLFLAREEEGIVVKVLDFGISKMVEEETKLTSAGMTMGTALYMSPEQLRSASKVDARSDIWSLGIILYELVCGQPPFVGSAPQIAAAIVSEEPPDITQRCAIPHGLGAVIHRALRRAPAERFATVAELAAALAPFAPPEGLGRAVAAQMARRSSSRQLPLDQPSMPPPRVSGFGVATVTAGARTEVSTSVSHEVNSSARLDSSARRAFVAALAVVAVVATVGAAAVVVVLLRHPVGGTSIASGAPSVAVDLAEAGAPSAPSAAVPPPQAAGGAPSGAPAASAAPSLVKPPQAQQQGAAAAPPHPRPTPSGAAAPVTTPRPLAVPAPKPSPVVNPPFLN